MDSADAQEENDGNSHQKKRQRVARACDQSSRPVEESKRKPDSGNPRDEKDGSSNQTKRQRVSRACDQCRSAREKCDGIQPLCFTCASNNRPCSYTANPKKRGIQPGYIRTLELALAWLFSNITGSEEALRVALEQDGSSIPAILSGKDAEGSSKLHKVWRRSNVCRAIDAVLSGGASTGTERAHSPLDETETDSAFLNNHADTSMMTPSSLDGLAAQSSVRSHIARSIAEHDPVDAPRTIKTSTIENRKIELPQNLWRLLDVYFSYTHSWFPIVEKHDILRLSYSYTDSGLIINENTPGAGNHAELWSILTIAAYQEATIDQTVSAADIYKTARSLIPSEGQFEIGHIKASLLLALVNLPNQKSTAWLLVGLAIRALAQLKLDLAISKKTYLGCFVLDTILSAEAKRFPYLRRDQLSLLGLLDVDGLEEWQTWEPCQGFEPLMRRSSVSGRSPARSLSVFNQLVRLCFAINDSLVGLLIQSSPAMDPFLIAADSQQPVNNPQILHLHLASHCSKILWNATDFQLRAGATAQASNALKKYTETFGVATMPAIFMLYISLLSQHGDLTALDLESRQFLGKLESELSYTYSRPRVERSVFLAQEASKFRSDELLRLPAWRSVDNNALSGEADLQTPSISTLKAPPEIETATTGTSNLIRTTPYSKTTPAMPVNQTPIQIFSPEVASKSLLLESVLSPHSDRQAANAVPYNDSALQNYPNYPSIDFDSLLDELAYLDGAARTDTQPQFMQNLGFAPSTDLSDVISSEYGQFDPLFSYMRPIKSAETAGVPQDPLLEGS